MKDRFARFAFPGQDSAMPVQDQQMSLVWVPDEVDVPGGYVRTTVSPDGLTITNKTLPLHIFYDGKIVRQLTREADGSWSVTTEGRGNNVIPGMNEVNTETGPDIFNALDKQLLEYVRQHHGSAVK
jgi:hypothetical protein